ncbi:MAG: hypothetical protein WDW38_006455 [Sanguina aurantia]
MIAATMRTRPVTSAALPARLPGPWPSSIRSVAGKPGTTKDGSCGGIEGSTASQSTRFWSDKVRRSVVVDAKFDLLLYGNAERAIVEIAHRLDRRAVQDILFRVALPSCAVKRPRAGSRSIRAASTSPAASRRMSTPMTRWVRRGQRQRRHLSKVDATSVSRAGRGGARASAAVTAALAMANASGVKVDLSMGLAANASVSSPPWSALETIKVPARESHRPVREGEGGRTNRWQRWAVLTSREDFQVDLVCGQAHQCDISIKRLGHPEVRVECKAHGEQTGEKVRARETARFQSDLPDLAIEMLPTGKFAVYLGNNQYDVGVIECMLHLVYRLEAATVTTLDGRAGAGTVSVTPEAMQRVQLMLKSCGDKVHAIKVHLRSALTILTDMTFDMISRTLLGDEVTTQALAPTRVGLPQSHGCSECEMSYKTAAGLLSHVRAKHAVKA